MVKHSHEGEGGGTQGQETNTAEIIRKEVMFGNIRIRCPGDKTEHEVPLGTTEFKCPVGNEILHIENFE